MGASKFLHRILKFINYANLCKFIQNQQKNATSIFLGRFWFCLFYLIGLGGGFKASTQNSLIMQIYANLFKINEKCYFSSISWPILILFVLSDRAWWGLRNFYTELWNSLIMQIYSKSKENATSPLFTKINGIPQICTSGGDVYYASRNLLIHLFFMISSLLILEFSRHRICLRLPLPAPKLCDRPRCCFWQAPPRCLSLESTLHQLGL